ncbi:MAG: phosphoglucomutase/phosphomannomutase family protein [Acidobacteria bacterium]|nr:phosphoglucomutase/phosphomannomutase family protein [Acidobacteriota bacterium]
MSAHIKFGTSGWRAVIAEEFTFENARRAVDGIAHYVCSTHPAHASAPPALLVGYDTRFLSEIFAARTAEILADYGIAALLSQESVPTPALAHEIRRRKTDGGINFTASHNPAEYNGIKFSTSNGAPALPEVTKQIEAAIANPPAPFPPAKVAVVERVDLRPAYLNDLSTKVNLELIRTSGLRMVYDPLYGAGHGFLNHLLSQAGIPLITIHGWRDVLFGGHPPEPAEEYLQSLKLAMAENGAALGLSTDGDADRFGILDQGGEFISPNHIIALLLDYLIESRPWAREAGWSGGVARSVATTHLIDAVARHHGLPVHETPVGFKYIGELIEQDRIILGGEESAGLTIRGHVPEKDGILACLLTAEMVACRQAPLRQQIKELFRKVGSYSPGRWNVPLTETVKNRFAERIRQEYSSFEGLRVRQTQRTDGLKLILEDDSWVLFRLSGTEPVCRLYCEAPSPAQLEELAQAARQFLFE